MIHVATDNREIAAFCRRHHIRRLAVFGSALRANFGPESNVNVLVQFEPGAHVGFLALARGPGTLDPSGPAGGPGAAGRSETSDS